MRSSWILCVALLLLTNGVVAESSPVVEIEKYRRLVDCSTKQFVTLERIQILQRVQRFDEPVEVASQCILVTGAYVGPCKIDQKETGQYEITSTKLIGAGSVIRQILLSEDWRELNLVGFAKYVCLPN